MSLPLRFFLQKNSRGQAAQQKRQGQLFPQETAASDNGQWCAIITESQNESNRK